MDWQIAQTTMATIEEIIVDGANGVTQAPRLVSFIPWWQIVTALLIVIAGICVRTRPRVRAWMILATCLAYVPGYREVFLKRADAPATSAYLALKVRAAQDAYVARAGMALANLAREACYEPALDATCLPYGGLQDGASLRIGGARRCSGGEARRVRMAVRHCSLDDLTVEIVP